MRAVSSRAQPIHDEEPLVGAHSTAASCVLFRTATIDGRVVNLNVPLPRPAARAQDVNRYFIPSGEQGALPLSMGFRSAAQSVHASRTIMLADFTTLLDAVPADAEHDEYRRAVLDDNVLGKKTASTRLWAYKKLRELYALDTRVPVFRALRTLWASDPAGRPVLALLGAAPRDALLRATINAVLSVPVGGEVSRESLQSAIVTARGERFSATTIEAILSHLLTSWADSGHLTGRRVRTRTEPCVTPTAMAYALLLGYLTGTRGLLLFSTPWASVLGAPVSHLQDLAREASRRGWLTYRGIGDVVDITFERLLTPAELRELSASS